MPRNPERPRNPPSPATSSSPRRRRTADAPPTDPPRWPRPKPPPPAIHVPATAHPHQGQPFTVGNVSHGMIYLRPVTRPAQAFAQPPSTPPSSADAPDPPRTPSRRRKENASPLPNCSPPVPAQRHGRARAHSVANRARCLPQFDGPRPHTTGVDDDELDFRALDVRIPRCNLGSPRFSPGGTPYMLGTSSVQASTLPEEGSAQPARFDMGWLWPPRRGAKEAASAGSRDAASAGSKDAVSASRSATIAQNAPSAGTSRVAGPAALAPSPFPDECSSPTSLQHAPSPPMPQAVGPLTIDPEIYDRISFPPGCDDPSVVRYDGNGDILAATPTRIIVQITSAAFVDYHLLSDFFLTYRLFMNAQDLASHLLSRLKWAIDRGDDTGKVVRVRTFVALRHWILNYFPDDFVPSLQFRQEFARALNTMTRDLGATGGPSDLKILGELKKCWRATCALYWDHVPADADATPDADIHPGGPPGTRQEEAVDATQQMMQRMLTLHPAPKLPPIGLHLDPFLPDPPRPRSDPPTSPPTLSRRSDSISSPPDVHRLRHAHKRSASFSDALRDHRTPLATAARTTATLALHMTLPYANSLVRGNRFPPTHPAVHVIAPPTPVPSSVPSSSSLPSSLDLRIPKQRPPPAVRRMLVTMRRALGVHKPEKKPREDTGAPHKKQRERKRSDSLFQAVASASELGGRADARVRVDLLGARAVEAFKRAMEDGARSATRSEMTEDTESVAAAGEGGLDGVEDGRTDGGEIGTAVSWGEGEGEARREGARVGLMGELTRDFLDSSSSLATERERVQGLLVPTSFLDDNSENGSELVTGGVSGQGSRRSSRSGESYRSRQGSRSREGSRSRQSSRSRQDSRSRQGSSRRRSRSCSPKPSAAPSDRDWPSEGDSTRAQVAPRNYSYLSRSSSARSLNPGVVLDKRLFELRRSRSFAFDRVSRRFNPDIEPVDENSSGFHSSVGFDKQSLKSARSFLVRNNSSLSQCSTGLDDVSQLSAVGGARKPADTEPRGLRRRPGGNLRTAATVGELDEGNRRYSTGSIATSSYSVYATSEMQSDLLRQGAMSPCTIASSRHRVNPPRFGNGMLSLGPMGGAAAAATAPDSPTASSRPRSDETGSATPEAGRARGSFEAGVRLLRELPDDDSDMGVDVALAKLEGTYQRKSMHSAPSFSEIRRSIAAKSLRYGTESSVVFSEQDPSAAGDADGFDRERQERFRHRHKHVVGQIPLPSPPLLDGAMSSKTLPSPDTLPIAEETEDPGLTHATASSDALAGNVELLSERSPEKRRSEGAEDVDLGRVDDELERVLESRQAGQEDRDDTSEASSELSFDAAGAHRPTNSSTVISDLGIAAHPLRHPPSPPLTLSQAHTLSPRSAAHHTNPSAASSISPPVSQSPLTTTTTTTTTTSTPTPTPPSLTPTSTHLPFILSYDSLLLAQHFTLLEHSTLSDLDWHSLIHLSYPTPPATPTWSDLLSHPAPLPAISLAIARFNLTVRWTQSQLLLTRDPRERARTIVKFIHIAARCRALGNFATLAQLVIALCSRDVARLAGTWALVPAVERAALRDLEALVQPHGNWARMRAEMEEAARGGGVVPWVGLFTHDLIWIAERPLWVADGRLVNFERCRAAAGVVKRLLRMVEAGGECAFAPVDGVAERCLWIAALEEGELEALSRGLAERGE